MEGSERMRRARDLDKRRKRLFFILCASIFCTAFIFLSVLNYLEGNVLEVTLNAVVILVMGTSFIALKRCDADMMIYRIAHLLICVLFAWSISRGTGGGTGLYWVFVVPLLFFYFFGKREGMIWSVIFSLWIGGVVFLTELFDWYSYGYIAVSRFFLILAIVSVIGYGLESSRYAFSRLLDEENKKLLHEKERLEEALREIKTLSGLIPICCNCKKVRDDEGYWQQVETYVRDRTHADFSHSICPTCLEKLCPEYPYSEEKKEKP